MIKIAHLYYDLLNLYGDNGNIKAIKHQLENQGVKVDIDLLTLNDNIDFDKYDLFYIGPGTKNNQRLALKDLLKYKDAINAAINNNKFFLVTGNALDMFGKCIYDEDKIKTLNIFDYEVKESNRVVNEVVAKSNILKGYVLGFQNHSSIMTSSKDYLFEIIKGSESLDGIKYKNFYGTYLIGPVLVRTPELLEYLVKQLIKSKNNKFKFKKFDLKYEKSAYDEYIKNYYSELIK